MVEYARCIYICWCRDKTPDYIRANELEFLILCGKLLHYTSEELQERLGKEQWYQQ